jgi:hypothetical protein
MASDPAKPTPLNQLSIDDPLVVAIRNAEDIMSQLKQLQDYDNEDACALRLVSDPDYQKRWDELTSRFDAERANIEALYERYKAAHILRVGNASTQ